MTTTNTTAFWRSLQSARDVKIVVGKETPRTFFVQQHLLESTSDYFVKALQNQGPGEKAEPGVLHFPEDKPVTWAILLCWMYKHELPKETFENNLSTPDELGDLAKSFVFQRSRTTFENAGFALIKVAIQSSLAHSPMRKLMAELIVENGENPLSQKELEELDGYGFLAQLMELQSEEAENIYNRGLNEDCEIGDFDELNEYMVGDGLAAPDDEARVLRGTEFDDASSA
ncbi:hypothetical protein LTR27_006461 [Elasticomyces elasticus]|nr:hypothetical protein LTR27_006461 [Elasticomyces elasticus]